jgi:hypothetical protein
MTVHCEGDCYIVEQLGEKQDFEAELSRLGFRHEHFTLYVARAPSGTSPWQRQDYTVTVVNVVTERQRVYRGGPAWEWVQECRRDLAQGVFGGPMRRAALTEATAQSANPPRRSAR